MGYYPLNLCICVIVGLTTRLTAQPEPELPTGYTPKQAVYGKNEMVASANPYASRAGMSILQKGGNAVDAAIAIQMVLNVVEPQSSGIGGGGILLYYQKEMEEVFAYDGRETAPLAVKETLFLDDKGQPLEFEKAIVGGRSVGVPGLLKMLETVHHEKGKLPWKELFIPAIELATNGFPISSRLAQMISRVPALAMFPETRALFFQNGQPYPEGAVYKNPKLASTLQEIANQGTDPFYKGEIANKIVNVVNSASVAPGALSLEDLANYEVRIRQPIRISYKGYMIYGFPPPSAGGIFLSQMLKMLEDKKFTHTSLGSPFFINLFCRASFLAYADRSYYLADPDFFPVPVEHLLNEKYLQSRSQIIEKKYFKAVEGQFPKRALARCLPIAVFEVPERPSTSQICVIDQEGNVISMTTSIEHAFGSTLSVEGFLLNNQLTDFSALPQKRGKRVANRVEPGKRPLTSMSPTLVFKEDSNEFVLAVGSTGGTRILDYVAKTLFGVLDFKMNIQEAISFPNYTATTGPIDLEQNTMLVTLVPALEKMGNSVEIRPLTSGTQGIEHKNGKLIGGVDPRREGLAIGG